METEPVSQTAPHLHQQSTTAVPTCSRVHIADFLSRGEANAVPLRDLVAVTGWNERDVRRQIEQERRDFVPIVSDNRSGYWLADDSGEARRFAQSMLHRSREIAKTARVVETAAERMVSADDL